MSTRSGPYEVEIDGAEWWWEHDTQPDHLDLHKHGNVLRISGPDVFIEVSVDAYISKWAHYLPFELTESMWNEYAADTSFASLWKMFQDELRARGRSPL